MRKVREWTAFSDLGYRYLEHGGFRWLAAESGQVFVRTVTDWSPSALEEQGNWKRWTKPRHTVFLGRQGSGSSYLIKL